MILSSNQDLIQQWSHSCILDDVALTNVVLSELCSAELGISDVSLRLFLLLYILSLHIPYLLSFVAIHYIYLQYVCET